MTIIYYTLVILALLVFIDPGAILVIGLVLLYITLFIPAILATASYRTGILANSGLYRALDWYVNWAMAKIDAINQKFQDKWACSLLDAASGRPQESDWPAEKRHIPWYSEDSGGPMGPLPPRSIKFYGSPRDRSVPQVTILPY